jgi:transposase
MREIEGALALQMACTHIAAMGVLGKFEGVFSSERRLWVYARDDRPWNGPDPPAALYLYSPDRKAERPVTHLAKFKGIVQVDGYVGFERLSDGGTIQLAGCWAHARRRFYDVQQATDSPVAAEALQRIAELYAIETAIRGQTSAARQNVRQSRSLPLVTKMKAWLETRFAQVPPRGGLADAIRYTLSRWDLLCRFLDDGRIELDTNTVERAIRPVTLGRKNHLFAGSDGGANRWATVCSLITTAKLNNVEPFAYLKDVLERLSDGHPMSRLADLLPWNWASSVAVAA